MLSSHKIIKAGTQASHPSERAAVTTNWQPKSSEYLLDDIEELNDMQFQEERHRIEELIREKESEKQAILTEAKLEAEVIKARATEEGYQEGEQKGLQEGFKAGFQQALLAATEEAESIKAHAKQVLADATAEAQQFYEEKRQDIIALAAQMAEKIIHETIDASDNKIIDLVTPILTRMDQESSFITISVRPESQDQMKTHIKDLEATYPLFRFVVFADPALEKNGCVIESSHAIIDLQIKQQLEAMVADLKEL